MSGSESVSGFAFVKMSLFSTEQGINPISCCLFYGIYGEESQLKEGGGEEITFGLRRYFWCNLSCE
jgi:hypothetical protein